MTIRVYIDRASLALDEKHKWDIVCLLRPHLGTETTEEKVRKFGSQAEAIRLVPSFAECDVAMLPMVWDYYLKNGKRNQGLEFASQASQNGKDVLVWNGGDPEIVIPFVNAVQFQLGLHRSVRRKPRRAFAISKWIDDYVVIYLDGLQQVREWSPVPSVGFCGYGAMAVWKRILYAARALTHQALFRAGKSERVPVPIPLPVTLRRRVLSSLSVAKGIKTNFVIRTRYKMGLRTPILASDPFATSKAEFVRNVLANDYTVCVRGTGNFSVRFYECLCCGRIPIFVNTDCILPYEFKVDWRELCVWVEESELDSLPEKLLAFHRAHSGRTFIALQGHCREVWKEYLSRDGFFRHFGEHFQNHTSPVPPGGSNSGLFKGVLV